MLGINVWPSLQTDPCAQKTRCKHHLLSVVMLVLFCTPTHTLTSPIADRRESTTTFDSQVYPAKFLTLEVLRKEAPHHIQKFVFLCQKKTRPHDTDEVFPLLCFSTFTA